MSVALRPMSEAEYEVWRPLAQIEYARDMVDAGMDEAAARAKADEDFPRLLPEGVGSPGQDLYTVVDGDEAVGVLWVAERDLNEGRGLFIYDVRMHESQRGKGYGRATMQLAEAEARRRGLAVVALNVFGGNDVARNMYRSLGYDEIAIWMTKRV
jgi:GNAT superfamily N-acetyltransferase